MNEQKPYFSIVIPLYNRANMIEKTIQSVFAQKTNLNYEILVVDDGSTDQSATIVNAINDPRVKYFYQDNSGANKARNHGIDNACGKYIAFLDSDDTFLPNHLENSFQILKESPESIIYSRIIVDRGEAGTFLKPPRALNENEHMAEYLLCDRGFLQTSTVILSTELAKKVRYDESLAYGQDTDFAIRLYATGASFKMIYEPGAIWVDIADTNRVSSKFTSHSRIKWLDRVKPIITEKAYLGDLGWAVAKGYAKEGKIQKAFFLYIKAIFNGCYSFRLSIVICLQILLGRHYRVLTDYYLSNKKIKQNEK